MTARTLEEIEELAAEATPGPWVTKGKSVKAVGSPSTGTAPNGWQGGICNCMGSGHGPRSRIDELAENNAALIAALPDLLAIAQGQREELERLRANASTAAFDKINDQLREANRENEELRGLLGNAGQADIERQYCNCNP